MNKDNISRPPKFFEEASIFRITGQYKSDFKDLRKNFILFLFNLLENGTLHRRMNFHEILRILTNNLSGFPYLIQEIKKIEN